MLIARASCPCCMSVLNFHAACPYCMSMLHVLPAVHARCSWCMSLQIVHTACQLHARAVCPCCIPHNLCGMPMSLLHALTACSCCMDMLHIHPLHFHAVCPCCKSILHVMSMLHVLATSYRVSAIILPIPRIRRA